MINSHEIWKCFCSNINLWLKIDWTKNKLTENCDHILDTFYRVISKCWIFVFVYVTLSTSLCDNTNIITRTVSITVFNNDLQLRNLIKRYWKGFLRSPQRYFFTNQSRFFFNFFLKRISEFCTRIIFFCHDIFWTNDTIYMHIFVVLFKRSPIHIGTFISFVAMLQFKVYLSVRIFVWAIT